MPPGNVAAESFHSFKLLGPFEYYRDGQSARLAGKLRCVLAALLLHSGKTVDSEYLIDVLWHHYPPREPRAALYSYIMRVRQALGIQHGKSPSLETVTDGYLLDVSGSEFDLHQHNRLRSIAQSAKQAQDATAEASALRSALGLWRGTALAGVPSDLLRQGPARRLEETRLVMLQRRIELDVLQGGGHDLVPELTELTSTYPLREVFWRQLMLAQHRAGQRADALKAYQQAAATLRNELGVDPGPDLQALHRVVLGGAEPEPAYGQRSLAALASVPRDDLDRSPHPRDLLASPAASAGRASVCQLPRDVPDFVGRQEAADSVLSALTTRGGNAPVIVGVDGAPGIGKTAFAIRIAHFARKFFPDGQLYASLGGATDGTSSCAAVGALLRATGVGHAQMPHHRLECAAMLRERLADRRVLMVLDDVAEAGHAEHMLPGTPGCAVLITSRRVLRALPGAWHIWLGPLTTDEIYEILKCIVGESRFRESAAQARQLAEMCGGHPLAARIVAARVAAQPSLSLTAMIERLTDECRKLDALAMPGMSLRRRLEESYLSLALPTQRVLQRIVWRADSEVSMPALASLADGDPEPIIEDLYTANLLETAGFTDAGEPRYRLTSMMTTYVRHCTEPGGR